MDGSGWRSKQEILTNFCKLISFWSGNGFNALAFHVLSILNWLLEISFTTNVSLNATRNSWHTTQFLKISIQTFLSINSLVCHEI